MLESEQLEKQIEHAKEIVAQAKKVEELGEIPLFKEIVLDGYCRDDAARLTRVAGDPNIDKESREHASEMSRAPGHFLRFMRGLVDQGRSAEGDIPELEKQAGEARWRETNGIEKEDDFDPSEVAETDVGEYEVEDASDENAEG